mgnify:CR=1 FL=1
MVNRKRQNREQRTRRGRAKVFGTAEKPRFAVYRSNRHLLLQLIDDVSGKTLVSVSTGELTEKKKTKTEQANAAGELLAKKAKEAKIEGAVFDRRYYKYHGRVKAVAEGARNGGLKV